MTASDYNHPSISRALYKGAKLCFRKPVQMSDLQGLWRFAMWNRNEIVMSAELPGFEWHQPKVITIIEGPECQPFMNTGKPSLEIAKVKETELRDKEKLLRNFLKKRKRAWNDFLHNKFLEAVDTAGINGKFELKYCLFVSAITTSHTVKIMVTFFLVRSSCEENIAANECAWTYKRACCKLFKGLFFVMVHMYYLVQLLF